MSTAAPSLQSEVGHIPSVAAAAITAVAVPVQLRAGPDKLLKTEYGTWLRRQRIFRYVLYFNMVLSLLVSPTLLMPWLASKVLIAEAWECGQGADEFSFPSHDLSHAGLVALVNWHLLFLVLHRVNRVLAGEVLKAFDARSVLLHGIAALTAYVVLAFATFGHLMGSKGRMVVVMEVIGVFPMLLVVTVLDACLLNRIIKFVFYCAVGFLLFVVFLGTTGIGLESLLPTAFPHNGSCGGVSCKFLRFAVNLALFNMAILQMKGIHGFWMNRPFAFYRPQFIWEDPKADHELAVEVEEEKASAAADSIGSDVYAPKKSPHKQITINLAGDSLNAIPAYMYEDAVAEEDVHVDSFDHGRSAISSATVREDLPTPTVLGSALPSPSALRSPSIEGALHKAAGKNQKVRFDDSDSDDAHVLVALAHGDSPSDVECTDAGPVVFEVPAVPQCQVDLEAQITHVEQCLAEKNQELAKVRAQLKRMIAAGGSGLFEHSISAGLGVPTGAVARPKGGALPVHMEPLGGHHSAGDRHVAWAEREPGDAGSSDGGGGDPSLIPFTALWPPGTAPTALWPSGTEPSPLRPEGELGPEAHVIPEPLTPDSSHSAWRSAGRHALPRSSQQPGEPPTGAELPHLDTAPPERPLSSP